MEGGSSNSLKRGATSLSDELRCRFCDRVFSAPHQLDRHEKASCQAAKEHLSDLLNQAKGLVSSREEWEVNKHRRLEPEGTSNLGGDDLRTWSHTPSAQRSETSLVK
jgi:hypothetical protein